MSLIRQQVNAAFYKLAVDCHSVASEALEEYGVEYLTHVPGHRLKAFAATVRGKHIRWLLKRLEEVSV